MPCIRAFIAAVAALLCSAVTAQTPPQPQPPEQPVDEGRLRFAVSVETVTLDVVVVDKKGRFVPGLTRDSFEIL
ncbi:MAG TPA: VWA domain-containing protein, partial [Vicinamibacteria bacterium]|nr:VWA domain-containing protein [Vicinamibacteria bacterium]